MIGAFQPHVAQEYGKEQFLITTNRSRLDVEMIHSFLTRSYWAKGIRREVVARSLENSLCFGVYRDTEQIGFARVISDYATYAYIGDVFIVESYCGHGLGKWLMQCIMEHPRLQGLRRWSLVTADAHGLYAQFGFTALDAPERYMEIYNSSVYEKTGR